MKKLSMFIAVSIILSLGNSAFANDATSIEATRIQPAKMHMSADDMQATGNMTDEERKEYMEEKKEEMKEKMEERKEEMKEMKEEMKAGIKENRAEAKENRAEFREMHKDEINAVKSALSDAEKEELKSLKESFKSEMEALRTELKDAQSDEDKADIHAELKELAQKHYDEVKEILANNNEALALVEKRKEVYSENQNLREENREMRKEYKNVKRETVETYRNAFVKRLGNKLETIPAENLGKISDRIDSMIEKYENNANVSESRKEAMLSALVALKEIIEERMEGGETQDEVLETIEDLLAE